MQSLPGITKHGRQWVCHVIFYRVGRKKQLSILFEDRYEAFLFREIYRNMEKVLLKASGRAVRYQKQKQ